MHAVDVFSDLMLEIGVVLGSAFSSDVVSSLM